MKIPYKYAVALTASLGLFMAVLDNTIVNVALTPMKNAFHTDLNSVQWVITGYFLSQAAVIPTAGYLSNRLGIKRVFMVCLAIFTLGSLLCGLSDLLKDGAGNPQISWLIFFRVLQGIGGGALFPLATAISFSAFPPSERAAGSAIVAIPVLLAPAFGPTIGGFLVDSIGWNSIFYVNVPIGAIALFLIWRVLKPDTQTAKASGEAQPGFDIPGLVLSMLGVIAIVYAFTVVSETDPKTVTVINPQGSINGWSDPVVWILLTVGIVLLLAFGFYETKIAKDPVLDLRLFKSYDYTVASVITWATRAVVFGSFFLLPVFLENIRYPTLSAVDTGLALMPQGLMAAVAIAIGGRLYNRIGPRWIVFGGMLSLTISTYLLTQLNNSTDGWSLAPALMLRGVGFGWGSFPVQTLALQAITGKALPKASSLYQVTAQIFSSIGIAVLTTIFVTQTAANVPTTAQAQTYFVQAALHQPAGQQFLTAHAGTTVQQIESQPALQATLFQAVLDSNKSQQYTQQYISQHPGLTPATLQSPQAPADYRTGLLQAAAPPALLNEVVGRSTSQAGIPALNAVFTIVMWATAALILVSLLLPGKPKYQETAEGAPSERHAMAMD